MFKRVWTYPIHRTRIHAESRTLVVAELEGKRIPFLPSGRQLLAWHLAEKRVLSFGVLQHNRRDILPFCQVSADSFIVGTSFGDLHHFTQPGQETARGKVGKRIATGISLAGPIVVFGTDSGELIGVETSVDA